MITNRLPLFLALFVFAGAASAEVVINEIHYHPTCDVPYTPCTERASSFIELYNADSASLDLSNYEFHDGVEYAFAEGTTLGPSQYLVLAEDAIGFENQFGFAPFAEFSGSLSNNGERIAIANAGQIVVDEVYYSDGTKTPGEWYFAADGEGSSLQLSDADADNNLSRFWGAYLPTPAALNTGVGLTPPPGVANMTWTHWPDPGTASSNTWSVMKARRSRSP